MSIEAGYVGNRGRDVFAGDGPAINVNQASIAELRDGQAASRGTIRRPFFNAFGWTQGIDYFCNCATNSYDSLQAKLTKRFSSGYSAKLNYTLQQARQHGGDQFQTDLRHASLNSRAARLGSSPQLRVLAGRAELPVGRGQALHVGRVAGLDAVLGGWQFNTNTSSRAACRSTSPIRTPARIATPAPTGRTSSATRTGRETRDQWFNAAPIGAAGSAFARPAAGTFGDLERNALRGPGYWRADASLFKHFQLGAQRRARAPHRGGEPLQPRQPR